MERPELEARLAEYPAIACCLGRHYRVLADRGLLAEDLLPLDWRATEAALARVVEQVEGFHAHWQQVPARPQWARADLFAALAELEGFRVLLDKGIGRVHALAFHPTRGGGAPDALVQTADGIRLYEMKSLWAYVENRKQDLQPRPGGAYVFGPHKRGRPPPGYCGVAQRNTTVLYQALAALLRTAARQLNAYAAHCGHPDCQRWVMLVVTQCQPILGTVQAGLELAREWLQRHPGAATGIVWVAGKDTVTELT